MICTGCPDYDDGYGSSACKTCQTMQGAVTERWRTVRPETYEPDVLETLAPTTIAVDRFDCLTEKEMTYICQWTMCKMSYARIADYHKTTKGSVQRVIGRAKKRLYNFNK